MQLQRDIDSIEKAGIRVVGISYDPVKTLKGFADKSKITYPLLSDPESEAIKAFGILNKEGRGRTKGVPHPCTYIVGKDGKVKAYLPGTVRTRHPTKDLIEAAKKAE